MKKLLILSFLALSACNSAAYTPSAEQVQQAKTDQLQADAEARVGMPRVTNFTEKRLANTIVELRDQPNLMTYAYVMVPGKGYCLLSKSIGFGLPYTTQTTNPMKSLNDKGYEGGDTLLPQAEPNGLYSSDSTNATWSIAVGPGGKPLPQYVESDMLVTISPLKGSHPDC